jgi:hypothetical protein
MGVPGGVPTSPGRNLKPTFDGTFVEAGAPLTSYALEHENGDRAIVDTKTASCISWIHNGVERITSKKNVHRFPDAKTVLPGEFFPEERAKKVSFDRMIFKIEDVPGFHGVEYRTDVTMRSDCLEYDVVIKNAGDKEHTVSIALELGLNKAKVVSKKGYTAITDNGATTATWKIPVGKLKETEFYIKIVPTD